MTKEEHRPRYVVPDNVAWVDGADFGAPNELYLTIVPDGQTVLLTDTARLLWLALSQKTEVLGLEGPSPILRQQITQFMASLERHRLVLRSSNVQK